MWETVKILELSKHCICAILSQNTDTKQHYLRHSVQLRDAGEDRHRQTWVRFLDHPVRFELYHASRAPHNDEMSYDKPAYHCGTRMVRHKNGQNLHVMRTGVICHNI